MKKNGSKIFLSSALFLVLLIGSGCSTTEKNNNISIKENISTSTVPDVIPQKNEVSTKKFTIQGITMTVPDKYSVVKVEDSIVWIKTDDIAHNVQLKLSAEHLNEEDYKAYKNDTQDFVDKKNSLTVGGKEIYHILDTRSVDAIDEYYLAKLGGAYFRFYPFIESDEKWPEGVELGFVPETKVTSMDIVNMLNSAK
jgi:plastocyanin